MNVFLIIHDLITHAEDKATFTNQLGGYIGAGLAMTAAAGVGAGQGVTAGLCAMAAARNPELMPKINLFWIVGSAISESSAIYALIIAFILIFVAK
ncbi:F0F1 ATP synthase subunit C [Mycoplasma bradburyae]|uniref:ATP synthase subunit c n=1 Tax=Mycoplasma bradburyae TaxID=2963128 RepID=A0AAW6HS22_9MOLU|nr:F0F1 ATP synthase subunit C [Mycoplasma bradburyae]MDC4163340.1 F0F1 ATP synthase subunit C [Mycoplasma bradburyae]MDC4181954.1 F0F1 ATP synthase subunit C [Mycoplasma bradburyae]MDC4182657.1 F0F1 ATP synthase subunit C [Mycoplasma bradburyae]MDC4183329.1 F0F1 ATP synthase subunit C [Mycoplasma bradburyae]MDC4184137.1 F0F1 ATP synthase subunit C [Mycoplasma bradburyae]